jgi:pimeloyl-ACP methyl ester carboxylesterase
MKNVKIATAVLAALVAGSVMAGPDADKIAATGVKVFQKSKMQGFDRIIFEYEGCEAWVVEPAKAAEGSPWAWCMEWPTAFQNRTGVKALLEAGYRWVTFNPAYAKHGNKATAGNQNDEMIAKRRKFQEFLINTLGLEKRVCLIGMSWGGFYSIRYASTHPECIKAIYIDAPLLDFSTLAGFKTKNWQSLAEFYPGITADYVGADDPMQPVHRTRAEKIAKAKIPVLCVYGGSDTVVPAESNCMRFAEAFEKAGGHILMWRDNKRGHHPHGLEPNESNVFLNFFNSAK